MKLYKVFDSESVYAQSTPFLSVEYFTDYNMALKRYSQIASVYSSKDNYLPISLEDGTTVSIISYHEARQAFEEGIIPDFYGDNPRLDLEHDGDDTHVNGLIIDPSEDGGYCGDYDQNSFGLKLVEADETYGYEYEFFAQCMDCKSFFESGRYCIQYIEKKIHEEMEFCINR